MRTPVVRLVTASTVVLFLASCESKGFVVPAADLTPPTAVWLQIDRPGQPLLNADATSASTPAHAAPGQAMQITARADDPDGGIQDVQIYVEEDTWVTNPDGTLSHSGGLNSSLPTASAPSQAKVGESASTSGRVTYALTPPPAGASVKRRYVVRAKALNFHGGATETQRLTVEVP